jgi:hypothetical protein
MNGSVWAPDQQRITRKSKRVENALTALRSIRGTILRR